jgi:hypothetical protein
MIITIFIMMVNIIQRRTDLIKPTSPVVLASPGDIIQRRRDVIKPTSPIVLASPGDIIQRIRDVIKCKSPVIFRNTGQHYAKATRHYNSPEVLEVWQGPLILYKLHQTL